MTSATEELHSLLDERRVSYQTHQTYYPHVWWRVGSKLYVATDILDGTLTVTNLTPEQAIAATLGNEINGETSDGYHTFNELYHHRAVLFSVIVRDHRELAWKARKHCDGTMYEGMFIVGIETPKGQATYHYDIDPYWDMFDCEEYEFAPKWDGHTPDDAIERIAELGSEATLCKAVKLEYEFMEVDGMKVYIPSSVYRTGCGAEVIWINKQLFKFCPNCGAKVGMEHNGRNH